MALESLIGPLYGEKQPYVLLLFGAAFSAIALLLSLWLFPSHASLFFVFFIVMASTPLYYRTLNREEKKDVKIDNEARLIMEHYKALRFLMFLFFGITISVAVGYSFLPSDIAGKVFKVQADTIAQINSRVTGDSVLSFDYFIIIFFNNFKVILFILLFSFIFGVGAIFILTWNATVIGVAMGNFFRTRITDYTALVGLGKVSAYFKIGSLSILRYAIHGIPEVAAYFTAGLAGGILSVAIIRRDIFRKSSSNILFDSSDLIVLSLLFLFVAAVLEVYVTPVVLDKWYFA